MCDARDVEVEEEEVQYVSQGELVRVEDKTTRVISPYIDQGFQVMHIHHQKPLSAYDEQHERNM